MKYGVKFSIEENTTKFVRFYNLFAESIKRPLLRINYINSFSNYLIITKAYNSDGDLVMHAYIMDKDIRRVRLLKSASLFRNISVRLTD
jgi:hypothetical protein